MFMRCILTLVNLITLASIPAYAFDLVIGPGKGIVWSGNPFSLNVSATHGHGIHSYAVGMGYFYSKSTCFQPSQVVLLPEGFHAYKITTGIYMAPRANINGQLFYGLEQNNPNGAYNHSFSGTIGYPETNVRESNGTPMRFDSPWCMDTSWVYAVSGEKKEINVSGDWIIYADGTQVPSPTIYKAPNLAANIVTNTGPSATLDTGNNNLYKLIVSDISLRVVGVTCNVNTQLNVNFGDIPYDSQNDAELAAVTSPFSVSCKQGALPASVNINASFRANTGFFNGVNTQLALTQGGGYITGEIGRGVTGTGACTSHPSSLNFSQTPINLTSLAATSPSVDYNNLITWRLCSGGSTLPVGSINSSAELSIVFS